MNDRNLAPEVQTQNELEQVIDKLSNRAIGINDWLDGAEGFGCKQKQEHLTKDTPERAYWHFGYSTALYDVIRLLSRTIGAT